MNRVSSGSNLSALLPANLSQGKKEIDEELAFHLEMMQQEYRNQGYSESTAKKIAESRFGDRQAIRNACLKENLTLPLLTAIFLILALSLVLFFSAIEIFSQTQWKRVSPFEAVQIIGDKVKVNIDQKWFELKSINQHSTNEILAYSKNKYHSMWEKRFVEDIYEVLEGLEILSDLNVEVELVNADGIAINQHITMTKLKRMMTWLYAREQQATTDKKLKYFKALRSDLKKKMAGDNKYG